jgi:hypothetical protein
MAKERLEVEVVPVVEPGSVKDVQDKLGKSVTAHIHAVADAASRVGNTGVGILSRHSRTAGDYVGRVKGFASSIGETFGDLKGLAGIGGGGATAAEGGGAAAAAGLGGLGAATAGIGLAIIAGAGALKGAADYVMGVLHSAANLAGLSNPAVADQFQEAIDDIWAVIGNKLVPVVSTATDFIRTFGDGLASMLPSAKDVQDVMQEFKPVLEDLRHDLAVIAPIIKDELVTSLKIAAEAIHALMDVSKMFRDYVSSWLPSWATTPTKPLEESRGYAAKRFSFTTGQDILKSNIIGSLSRGKQDPGVEAQKKTASNTDKIVSALIQLQQFTIASVLPSIDLRLITGNGG